MTTVLDKQKASVLDTRAKKATVSPAVYAAEGWLGQAEISR